MAASLDLSPSPNRRTSKRILDAATPLFDAVKAAPTSFRSSFPAVLQNNNFALALHVTKQHAFLEVAGKFRAQRSRETERLAAYRQIFTSTISDEAAIFAFSGARLARISGLTADAPHAFALGSDFSMCAWDMRSTTTVRGKPRSFDVDLIYVVGFGKSILEADCWQEFDALIRLTLSDWSGMR